MQDTATCSTPKPRAGIEGLDVYRVAVEFYRLLRQSTRGRRGHVIDQSYRAAESVILNIAEAYPMPGADRARRFRIAGGEAAECHAGLDLMEIRGELRGPALSQLRGLLDRTRAMLWRLGRP
jgi:four helix bundle protein